MARNQLSPRKPGRVGSRRILLSLVACCAYACTSQWEVRTEQLSRLDGFRPEGPPVVLETTKGETVRYDKESGLVMDVGWESELPIEKRRSLKVTPRALIASMPDSPCLEEKVLLGDIQKVQVTRPNKVGTGFLIAGLSLLGAGIPVMIGMLAVFSPHPG